jgi:tetratricopeptide (TPR) repeat protein
MSNPLSGSRTLAPIAGLAVLVLATAVYWPIHAAGFAWDDFKFLLDSGWMTDRSRWPGLIVHGFPEWAGYYRPLGVALYILETNLSGFAPAPMHFLSLGIHLANIVLVGLLARTILQECSHASGRAETIAWPCAAMAIYALHPALVEPVVWISAQYDLLTTAFTLLGVIINLRARSLALRAMGTGVCFLLAASAKEAALSFPFLLAVFDWLRTRHMLADEQGPLGALRAIVRRQWPVYTAVFVAGLVYLGLRVLGIGFLINPATKAAWSFWPQLQTACFTYLAYLKLIIWPMSGLAPMYDIDVAPFATFSAKLLAMDAGAFAVAAIGFWQLWRRTALGALIVGITAALLPVLHLIPQEFAGSLYHCRYAMTAIGTACALLPLLLHDAGLRSRSPWFARSLALVASVWLVFAVVNTRACIPLWSDDVRLWRWALLENPGSLKAQESLLGAYVRTGDLDRAKALADAMMRGEARASFGSMLNVAALRIALRDVSGASLALAEAKRNMSASSIRYSYLRSYMLLTGQLSELRNDFTEAEEAYSAAIAFEPQLPEGYMRLAMLEVRAGKRDEALHLYEQALLRYTPTDRARIRAQFDAMFADPIRR